MRRETSELQREVARDAQSVAFHQRSSDVFRDPICTLLGSTPPGCHLHHEDQDDIALLGWGDPHTTSFATGTGWGGRCNTVQHIFLWEMFFCGAVVFSPMFQHNGFILKDPVFSGTTKHLLRFAGVFFFSFGLLNVLDFCFFSTLLHRSSHPQGGVVNLKLNRSASKAFASL